MNIIVQANRAVHAAAMLCVWLSSLTLIAIVLLTVLDTGLRYLVNRPIAGSNEMVEILLSFLIMLALPICTINRVHVRVDLLDNLLGSLGCKLADLFTGSLGIIILYFLSERCWRKAKDALEFGDATIFLNFPQWPMYMAISAATAIVALILLLQMVTLLFGDSPDERS